MNGLAAARAPVGAAPVGSPLGASGHERRFAALVGARHAIGFGFGRTALALALEQLEPGSRRAEVVCSALTCRVIPLAIRHGGFTPRFADIDSETLNLDPTRLAGRLGPASHALVFQHTYGRGPGLADVAEIARERGLALIEDRAQCFPVRQPLVGRAAIYSNNLLKPLPAGSGAMLVTDDDALAIRIRGVRETLPVPGAWSDLAGQAAGVAHDRWLTSRLYWNAYDLSRWLDDRQPGSLEALLGRDLARTAVRVTPRQERQGDRWLERAPALQAARRATVERYRERLPNVASPGPGIAAGPWYYYPIRVANKPGLLAEARRRRIEIVAWPIRTPIYPAVTDAAVRTLGLVPGQCPVAERVALELIGLPTAIDAVELERVVGLVRDGAGSEPA